MTSGEPLQVVPRITLHTQTQMPLGFSRIWGTTVDYYSWRRFPEDVVLPAKQGHGTTCNARNVYITCTHFRPYDVSCLPRIQIYRWWYFVDCADHDTRLLPHDCGPGIAVNWTVQVVAGDLSDDFINFTTLLDQVSTVVFNYHCRLVVVRFGDFRQGFGTCLNNLPKQRHRFPSIWRYTWYVS